MKREDGIQDGKEKVGLCDACVVGAVAVAGESVGAGVGVTTAG